MTEIRFTRDYRGKLTRELFYEAGTVIEADYSTALQIIAEDAAELVTSETSDEKSKRKRTTKK